MLLLREIAVSPRRWPVTASFGVCLRLGERVACLCLCERVACQREPGAVSGLLASLRLQGGQAARSSTPFETV